MVNEVDRFGGQIYVGDMKEEDEGKYSGYKLQETAAVYSSSPELRKFSAEPPRLVSRT